MKTLNIDPETVKVLKTRGGTWGVFENHAFDSSNAGHLQFLKVGDGCTFPTAPTTFPHDTASGTGWKYVRVAIVEAKDIPDDGELKVP